MDLVGAWLRQLLGAGMAAAIVPVAMLAALVVVLVGAGGFGGLGSLGQLIEGPQISPTEEAAAREPRGTQVADVAPATLVAQVRAPAVRRQTGTPRNQAPRTPRQPPPPQAKIVPPARTPVALVPPALPPTSPLPPPEPPSRPKPVVEAVLDTTVGTVREVVGEVIDRLGQTVERIIGPPPLGR